MYSISHLPARRARGFTLIEAMVGVAILGVLVGFGIPKMNEWLQVSRATGATEFYAEGLRLARAQAQLKNASSRFVMSENPTSGQLDWQVDVCFPTAALACTDTTGNWSTTGAPASNDPDGAANGFKSVFRAATGMPSASYMVHEVKPIGSTDVYFTAMGWVDTTIADRVERIELRPSPSNTGAFRDSAVAVRLSGVVTKCDPSIPDTVSDSRSCNPPPP